MPKNKVNEAPYSMDANLLHVSMKERFWKIHGNLLMSRCLLQQPLMKKHLIKLLIEIEFKKGDPIALNGKKLSPSSLLSKLNSIGGSNAVGRIDIVENRFIGMKSRGVYETPGVQFYIPHIER